MGYGILTWPAFLMISFTVLALTGFAFHFSGSW